MLGARIEERRKAIGLSQSELARRARVPQTTMNGLIHGSQRSTPHLIRIAQALQTSPAFLTGETDDPDAGAPPPPSPEPQVVMLGVILPPERALAQMFEGLLEGLDRAAPVDEQALLLAQRLPIGLSQLRDLLPDEVRPARARTTAAAPEPMHLEPQRS